MLAIASPGQQVTSLAYASPSLDVLPYAAPAVTSLRGTVVTTYAGGSTVVEHPLYASTLGLSTSYNVFLPAGYAESSQRYPVLYMLHGVAGDATEWQSIGLLEAADRMIQDGEIEPMLIVLPNGGANYWVNHADGARWGDYLVSDVVASVDREYRTVPDRAARAVGGLSMGGEGALRMAMLNPDVFGIAAAHSPSLRTAYDQLSPELQRLYGTEADWRAASGLWLADRHRRRRPADDLARRRRGRPVAAERRAAARPPRRARREPPIRGAARRARRRVLDRQRRPTT